MSDFRPLWGVGRLMANAILNFHFDYLTPSLGEPVKQVHLHGQDGPKVACGQGGSWSLDPLILPELPLSTEPPVPKHQERGGEKESRQEHLVKDLEPNIARPGHVSASNQCVLNKEKL